MKKNASVKLSPGEMEILEILWKEGKLTLAQAHEAFLKLGREIEYSTVHTRLDRMVRKGYLKRDKGYGGAYMPLLDRNQTVGRFLDPTAGLYRSNFAPLILQLAGQRKLNDEEIQAMRLLLDQLEAEETAENNAKD